MEELRDAINKVMGGQCDIEKRDDRIALAALIFVKLSDNTDKELKMLKELVDEAKKKHPQEDKMTTVHIVSDGKTSDEIINEVSKILKSVFGE